MAMKEDILEQLVEEYLLHRGYFVRHNVKFLPDKSDPDHNSRNDSNHSDIDVIGIHPLKEGNDRVWVVNCKSWQGGFRPKKWIADIAEKKIVSGRDSWKAFRELANDKWSGGFMAVTCH